MSGRCRGLAVFLGGLGLLLGPEGSARGAPPSFPGAEGFGAETPGGRGGRVIEVTSLANAGPGSLREALDATGPRIVVFRVSGEIALETPIIVRQPFVTVAGQTAPGDGVTLRNAGANNWATFAVQTHDVILRYLRLRPGRTGSGVNTNDALQISYGAYNVVVDHCSMSWATDEILDLGWPGLPGVHDVTIQWSILAEGLKSPASDWDSKGVLAAKAGCERVSFHHNLLAHNQDRNPRVGSEGRWDLVNNLVYGPGRSNADLFDLESQPILANFVGNLVRKGPGSHPYLGSELKIYEDGDDGPGFAVYIRDNLGPNRPTGTEPETAILSCFTVYGTPPHPACDPLPYIVSERHDFPPVTTYPAAALMDRLLPAVGATRPVRDAVDTCLVDGVVHLQGRLIQEPAEGCGPWPVLAPGLPPADGDHDGMPDAWEIAHGFDPQLSADGAADADGDEWTNVEEFLNATHPRDRDNDGQPDAEDCAPQDPASGVPPEVAGVRFAAGSRQDLLWDPAPFADRFDVTRGAPGLFGSGDYGACQNSGDPDLGDTSFRDSETPPAAAAFGYLVAARDLGCPVRGTLGSTSAGAVRVNLGPAACP